MNKKLRKTRVGRTNTLEAMACVCSCGCPDCLPSTCSGGGAFEQSEESSKLYTNFLVNRRRTSKKN